jgi:hypothetical protein
MILMLMDFHHRVGHYDISARKMKKHNIEPLPTYEELYAMEETKSGYIKSRR